MYAISFFLYFESINYIVNIDEAWSGKGIVIIKGVLL